MFRPIRSKRADEREKKKCNKILFLVNGAFLLKVTLEFLIAYDIFQSELNYKTNPIDVWNLLLDAGG